MRKVMAPISALAFAGLAGAALAQPQQTAPRPYYVGNEGLGLPIAPPAPDAAPAPFAHASANVRMFGALYNAESCVYDAARGLILAPSRGAPQSVRGNDAWIAFINHDGSVHTPRWIGIQNPGAQRETKTPPLVLNEPFGSAIHNGVLYLADCDGGAPDPANAGQPTPSIAVLRLFDLASGRPLRSIAVNGTTGLNDIAVAANGTIYGTDTGAGTLWTITPDGAASILAQGAPLSRPNGVEIDGDGGIVVVNMGTADVITFAPDGSVVRTQQAAQAGNDGIVIMPDGVKFVSSVLEGGVSMIPPNGAARLIAENIPSAASMCYDSGANQLVIPMNANNGLAFVPLEGIWPPRR